MPIRESAGVISFTPPDRLFKQTGVAYDDEFAVMDRNNLVKQIAFEIRPQTSGPGTLTLRADISGDQTIDIGGTFAVGPSFGVIQPDHGTSPTATIPTDTVTFTSSDNSITITGNSTTNVVDFIAPDAAAITSLTGDVTATGPGASAATLATVNANIGSFGSSTSIPSLTVNAKGLVTAASGNVVIAPAGTLTGTTLASNVVTSSLTTVGTIATGVWNGTKVDIAHGGTNSTTSLNNNRVIQSSGGAIVEAAAITAARALKSDSNGIPVASTATAASLDALSGTNTGDQTITLTGDVTGSGTGSFSATIANLAVTNAKIANSTIDLTAKVTGVLPVANGGTNSSTALSNNFAMQSSGGKVVESVHAIDSSSRFLFGAGEVVKVVALSDAATIATDASLGNMFTVVLGGNRTLGAPTNPTAGQKCVWRFRQDGTGSRTLAYNAAFRFGTDISTITLTTGANKSDYMGAIYNSTDSTWDVVAAVQGF